MHRNEAKRRQIQINVKDRVNKWTFFYDSIRSQNTDRLDFFGRIILKSDFNFFFSQIIIFLFKNILIFSVVPEPRPSCNRRRPMRGRQHPSWHLRRRKPNSGNETDLAQGHGDVTSQPVLALQIALPSSSKLKKVLNKIGYFKINQKLKLLDL